MPTKEAEPSDETQKCFLCSQNLTEMTVEERSKHINQCIDKNPSPHSQQQEEEDNTVLCELCQKDITR